MLYNFTLYYHNYQLKFRFRIMIWISLFATDGRRDRCDYLWLV